MNGNAGVIKMHMTSHIADICLNEVIAVLLDVLVAAPVWCLSCYFGDIFRFCWSPFFLPNSDPALPKSIHEAMHTPFNKHKVEMWRCDELVGEVQVDTR